MNNESVIKPPFSNDMDMYITISFQIATNFAKDRRRLRNNIIADMFFLCVSFTSDYFIGIALKKKSFDAHGSRRVFLPMNE